MNYHNITKCDMLNGEGLRVVLWVSGCTHYCPNCQNQQTWSHNSGILFDKETKKELFAELEKDYISGVTFSGGDPLSELNRYEILELAKEIKNTFPTKNIWLYTGYSYCEIEGLKGIEYIDILVDGRYIEALNFPSPKWRGSSNQRVIDVKESLRSGQIVTKEDI